MMVSSNNRKSILGLIVFGVILAAVTYIMAGKYGLINTKKLNFSFDSSFDMYKSRKTDIKRISSSIIDINEETFKSNGFKNLVKPSIDSIDPSKIKAGNNNPFK